MKEIIEFVTFHNQFYLCDETAKMETDGDFWSHEADHFRVAVAEGLIGVPITNDVSARLEVINYNGRPPRTANLSVADHVVELGLNIPSGHMQVKQCPNFDVVLELGVHPGNYRVRISSFNLGNVDEDKYLIETWPSDDSSVVVIKQFETQA